MVTAGKAANCVGLAMTPNSDMQLMKHPYCWIMWALIELILVHFFSQPIDIGVDDAVRSVPERCRFFSWKCPETP